MVHVGIGYDVHAFVAGRKLILGGVIFRTQKAWRKIQLGKIQMNAKTVRLTLALLILAGLETGCGVLSAFTYHAPDYGREPTDSDVQSAVKTWEIETFANGSEINPVSETPTVKSYLHRTLYRDRIYCYRMTITLQDVTRLSWDLRCGGHTDLPGQTVFVLWMKNGKVLLWEDKESLEAPLSLSP
jgi:hypothetical protein